ncbi:MAG: DUF3500 domain-containing protein [Actinomycetes bacterium]
MTSLRREVAGRMAQAAVALLESLDDVQRSVVQWPFDDTAERELWFYTPTDHGGLPLSMMQPTQQQRTMQLVAAGLSYPGYATASTIMGLENVLDHVEAWGREWGRERGRDPGLYYVRVFGDPTGDGPWSWRFGGHHISVSHLIIDGDVAATTPLFFGADPASAPLLGPHPLRPLAGIEDVARELVRSLDESQLSKALVAPVAPVDLVGANRSHFGLGDGDLPLPLADVWRTHFVGDLGDQVVVIQDAMEQAAGLTSEHLEAVRLTRVPRGLIAGDLRLEQREMLKALLDLYVNRLPAALASDEAAKYASDADLCDLRFLWAGSREPGEGHYYRVQGDTVMVEYDNTQRGAQHVHSVWRDPRRDFGIGPLAAHYSREH